MQDWKVRGAWDKIPLGAIFCYWVFIFTWYCRIYRNSPLRKNSIVLRVSENSSTSKKKIFLIEFSLNVVDFALNSEELINRWGMNLGQFKDILCHLCLPGNVLASLSLAKEVAGLNATILKQFVTEFREFSENILEKLILFVHIKQSG